MKFIWARIKFVERNQKGFSLIEVIVAVALLGIIGTPFISALGTSQEVVSISDERETAVNLAETQLEYVKQQSYASSYAPDPLPAQYTGYSVAIAVEDTIDRDSFLQKLTVTVKHHDEFVIALEGFKVVR